MKRLLALGLAISLGGCAYSPSYSYYGYYRPHGNPYGPSPAPSYQRYPPPQSYQRPAQSYQSQPQAGSYQSEPLTPPNDDQPIILNPPKPNTGSLYKPEITPP
jgi:hypothetical protein